MRYFLLICIALICVSNWFDPAVGQPGSNQSPATQPAQPPAAPPPGGNMTEKLDRVAEVAARAVFNAHGGPRWNTHSALQTEVSMSFGDHSLAGTLTFQINGDGIRLELRDGTTLVTNGGQTVWVSPASSPLKQGEAARLLRSFKVFAAAPLLLAERGMKQTAYRTLHFMGEDADTFRLTPGPDAASAVGEGGYFVAYANQRTRQMRGLANIALPMALPVQDQDSAPRAYTVAYSKMQIVEGVALPAEWSFYEWTEASGARGQALGNGTSQQPQFVKPAGDAFSQPADSREDKPEGG